MYDKTYIKWTLLFSLEHSSQDSMTLKGVGHIATDKNILKFSP